MLGIGYSYTLQIYIINHDTKEKYVHVYLNECLT